MMLVVNGVKRSFHFLPCYYKSLEMWMHAVLWGVIASSEAEMYQQPGTWMHAMLWGAIALI